MKKSWLTGIFLIFSLVSTAQESDNLVKKLVKKVFSSEKDSTRGSSFMVLPAVAYAQETGFEYGIASNYSFYVDKNNPTSRTSNILLMGTLTTKHQKKINLNADIWTKDNDYHIITELRMRDWPFNFYGIGNDTWKADEDYLDQTLYRLKVDVEKKIQNKLYIGINSSYDKAIFQDVIPGGIFEEEQVYGKLGGQYVTLGTSILYDSRDNTTYTNKGLYTRLKYTYAPDFFGKDNFTGSMTEADIRVFTPLQSKVNFAAQLLYRGTYGEHVPFYALRDLGGDMSMRGYYLGRYKDKNYLTAQAELRYRFHPRFGINTFLGGGSTFSREHTMRIVPSYGAGLRYFFSLEHGSSIRFDYAYGEKRPGEIRQSGFYLSLSEAF